MSQLVDGKRIIVRDKSIIPACDVGTLDKLSELIEQTHDVDGIGAYKIDGPGSCVLRIGLEVAVKEVRSWTDLPIIYDHQKAGTDIPDMGKNFATNLEGLVEAAILFPFTGPETQTAWTKALQDGGIVPIIGAEMTHPGFNEVEGGYIAIDAPKRMFELAVADGVRDFVVPGNKPAVVAACRELLAGLLGDESFALYAPGFVKQGGVISEAGHAAGPFFHAIVGRGIYEQEDMQAAAIEHCKAIAG
jgi:orotidine-5'-phosphate decarboxylase